jgi:dephospho-CoA kinase
MITIGLTGGIAAGKSTIAQRWQDSGGDETAVIDSDELARQTLMTDTPTWHEVVREFGEGILKPDRTVDRGKLGDVVFGDEQKRATLNSIVHPAVRQMWSRRVKQLAAAGVTRQAVVVVPLLFEVGAESEFACVVCTACSDSTQLNRLMQRGLAESQARARILAQWPMTLKVERADFVIWNDGTLAVMHRQSDIVWNTIKETYHHAPTQR